MFLGGGREIVFRRYISRKVEGNRVDGVGFFKSGAEVGLRIDCFWKIEGK